MRMLRNLIGPHKGQVTPFLDHEAENALASGFAEVPEAVPEVGPAPADGAESASAVTAPRKTTKKGGR